jgi:hypothetical protein
MPRHYRLPDAIFDVTIGWFDRLARYKQRHQSRTDAISVMWSALRWVLFKGGNAAACLYPTNSVDEPQVKRIFSINKNLFH